MSDMSTEHATSKNDGQALNSHLAHTRRKGSRRVLCITTLALAASLVGCGAGGILPADGGEDQATPNPFDIILGE